MSVEFVVLCRKPLPRREGWSLSIGPVMINEGGSTSSPLARDAEAILTFSSRATGSDVSLKMATELARLVEGVVLDEEGELHADFAASGEAPISAASLEARLREVWDRHQELQGKQLAKAIAKFEEELDRDPLVKAANDWSDL